MKDIISGKFIIPGKLSFNIPKIISGNKTQYKKMYFINFTEIIN